MSSSQSKLSNPISTGGGGVHFENHVQSLYVAIMLSNGCAPPLDDCRINTIKLQGKVDDYDTDDLIVFGETRNSKRPRKLLGQIKRSISITDGDKIFAATLAAMWSDFNNPKLFTKGKGADVLALLTGPISTTDYKNVQWLLHHAKTHDSSEFYRDVNTAKFGPPERQEKLGTFRLHLKNAKGCTVTDEELYDFLNHFHWLGFDLGEETGVVRSLLQSHLAMCNPPCPINLFARICDFVASCNQHAGAITVDNVPDDILEAFEPKEVITAPKYIPKTPSTTDWNQHEHAELLAVLNLIGQWRENRPDDLSALFSAQRNEDCSDGISVLNTIIGEDQSIWLPKLRELLQLPDSPFIFKNHIWKIKDRIDLWSSLGSRLFDEHLERFKQTAITVLTERNPAFDLENDKRWAANIYGKTTSFSLQIRNGIANGLALLGSKPRELSHCSTGKAEGTAVIAVRDILSNADWVLWGSLQDVLPALAEAAPQTCFDAIEKALQTSPCPFDELFAQESQGITGRNYMTGLLWALESLAWDAEYLSHVCLILGQLASRDPGGNWGNRPSHSLTTILLPWLPQTLAPIEKRKAAVRSLAKECPEVAWKLLISLLPGKTFTTSPSYKPKYRNTLPSDREDRPSHENYQTQIDIYSHCAVELAGSDPVKLAELIENFGNLPTSAFDALIEVLTSVSLEQISDESCGVLWEQLKKLGCSCDWDRTCFTMDEERSKSVLKVFVDLYNKGKIYRGVRMVNWDPQALTALSDEEVIYKEQQGKTVLLEIQNCGRKRLLCRCHHAPRNHYGRHRHVHQSERPENRSFERQKSDCSVDKS